jgi:hypothetical protein
MDVCPGCLSGQAQIRFIGKAELDRLEAQKDKADQLWAILVMLKRDFDPHVSNPNKLEIDRSSWDEAVKRAQKLKP